ncbi:MAG: iron-sulfur cluster assembly accessory protein, partial [Chitinophagia bacterium]|nr:iron-sulfur cluster assembly accessory protein [Chitinophagia bacterium]
MSTITDTSLTPVSFTAGAIEEIQRLMHAPDFDQQQRLRVGVKGGGCSGMTYVLGFDVTTDKDLL